MRLKKAILKARTYHSPDGTLDVTPARLKHWESTFRKMQDASLGVPISWDHSDDPSKIIPVKFSTVKGKKRSAADSLGWLEDFKVAADGNSAELTLDIRDVNASEKAQANVVELSPIIHKEWKDGDGVTWSDCITHADLVIHPVDHGQGPFTPAEQPVIACSLRMALEAPVYRMGDDDPDQQTPNGTDTPADNPDLPTENSDEDGKRLEAVLAHLKTMAIVLPSDTDQENFMDRLLTGLMTAKAAKDQAEAEEEAEEEDDDDMSKASEAQPQFAAMSLYAERQHQGQLTGRLEALVKSGRATPAEKQPQKEALGAVKLSLNEQGEPQKSAVEMWIESREALPAGAVWPVESRLRMSHAQESAVSDPSVLDELNDDQADEIVDQVFKRNKRKKQAATA